MSHPTRQLEKLSLDENMPTTRSQAALDGSSAGLEQGRSLVPSQRQVIPGKRVRRERGGTVKGLKHRQHQNQHQQSDYRSSDQDSEDKKENDEDEVEESSSSGIIASMVLAARSKIVYDIESLEMESRARALAGLTGQFDVVYCREATPSSYEFQLMERPRIRIRDQGVECTCSEFGYRPNMACRHIFWLVDQVYDSISPSEPPPCLPLSRNGFSPKLPPLHDILNGRLESLANHLEWPLIPGNESSGISNGEATVAGGLSRQEQVRDIMSAFNEMTLPEDFRKDLIETSSTTLTPRTPAECVVQGDFEATIFRLAVHDDNVYSSIRKAMPAGACAAIYFDKVHQKSRDLLLRFDKYRRTGQIPPDNGGSGRQKTPLEVSQVAAELQHHVQKIRRNLAARKPYGTKGAIEALITLLQDISARNIDAFENNHWGRIAPPGEDADDRNLYEQLIGQAASTSASASRSSKNNGSSSNTQAERGCFIVDVLSEVPPSVLASYLSTLFDILAKVEINRAPTSFVLKLKALIQDAQSSQGAAAAAATSATRAKRPATVEAGGSQKRTR